MHRHSSDSTNAVIQFIQMKNILKILLNGQSVGGHLPLRPPNQNVGGRLPVPPIIAALAGTPAERGPSLESIYWVSLTVDLCEGNKIISLKNLFHHSPSKRKKIRGPWARAQCAHWLRRPCHGALVPHNLRQ